MELIPFFKLGKGRKDEKSRRWIYNRDSSLERILRLVFPLQVGLAITAVLYIYTYEYNDDIIELVSSYTKFDHIG